MVVAMKVRRVQEIDIVDLPKKIRQARKAKGLSILALEKISGIHRSSLHKFEAGSVGAIAYPTLQKLEQILDTDFGIKFE